LDTKGYRTITGNEEKTPVMKQHITLKHDIQHPRFDADKLENYNLLIFVGHDVFSYALVQQDGLTELDTVMYLKAYTIAPQENFFSYKLLISDIFEEEELFANVFASVRISMNTAKYTLVPKILFKPGNLKDYFVFNHASDDDCQLFYDEINNNDFVVIYAVDHYLLSAIDVAFDNYTLKHSTSYLLPDVLGQQQSMHNVIYLHVQKEFVDAVCIKKGKLHLLNTYKYSAPNDFLYYVINMCKKTNVNYKKDKCVVFGNITSTDYHYQLLNKYVPNNQLASFPSSKHYHKQLDTILPHEYYNLLCIK